MPWAAAAELEVALCALPQGRHGPAGPLGGAGGPQLAVRGSNLLLRAPLRLSLGPLLPGPPYAAALGLTLTAPPLLDGAVALRAELWRSGQDEVRAPRGGPRKQGRGGSR